ncbi:MAG: hypothetical protein HC836_23330 [Richelia sp. RM2_1_2]|nr:hypothetical protein [Richelia sp. RM2_1_2]
MARSRRVFYLYCNDKQTFLNRKYEFARISKYKGSWKQIHTILSHYEHLIPYRLDYHIPVDLSFVSSLDVIEVDQLTLTKKIFKLEDLLHERRRERVIYRLYGWQVVRAYTKAKSTAVFRYIVSFPYNGPSYQYFQMLENF